jgi:hypothetical protein
MTDQFATMETDHLRRLVRELHGNARHANKQYDTAAKALKARLKQDRKQNDQATNS